MVDRGFSRSSDASFRLTELVTLMQYADVMHHWHRSRSDVLRTFRLCLLSEKRMGLVRDYRRAVYPISI